MANGMPPARKRTSTGGESAAPETPRKRASTGAEAPAPEAPRRRTAPSAEAPGAEGPRRRTATGTAKAAAGAKLVCTAGPKAGTEFPLSGEEVVIGRAAENVVSIPDTSVSRRHVMLRKTAEGWLASDMGSGNGTLLNGEPLTEETVLRNADLLVCGDTELSFVDVENSTDRRALPAQARRNSALEVPVRRPGSAGARPDGRPRVVRSSTRAPVDPVAQKRKKRFMAYAGLFIVLLMCIALAVKIKQNNERKSQARQQAEQEERRAQIAATFQDAKNLVRAGKWDQAKVKLEETQQLGPNYPGVQDLLVRSEKEIPNQVALTEAEAAVKAGQIAAAAQALAKVTEDTLQYDRLRAIKSQFDEKVVARLGEARRTADLAPKVSTAKDVSKYDEVLAITGDILAAFPENRDAKVLHEQAQSARDVLTRPPPVVVPKTVLPWETATNLFVDGDLTGAFSVANACVGKFPRCKALVGQMTEFQSLYRKVEDLDAKGLTQLLALDAKIAGSGRMSKMARSAGTRAATIYYKSASAAKAAGQYPRALEYAVKALKADPNNSGAQAIINDLRAKAKDVYMFGYSIKDSNPEDAVAKFREVVGMTPADDETHQKAQRRIEELAK